MPPKNLPQGAKEIYTAAEANAKKSTCKDSGDRKDECAARVAWSAVKNKYKKVGDKWVPKADVESFSMVITRTSYDKLTNTRRWKAIASDTKDDLYNDNMTLELYNDFMSRIESKELPPESYRGEFWSGGMPYLSVSHYPDLNGKGVPGPVDTVYVDGTELKATGRFNDTPLGKACFQAISRDLDIKSAIPDSEKIRISIAFLDWKHKHKSNGFIFDRSESEDVMCPECLKELIMSATTDERPKGKEFIQGHLVHLALTRVPVNERTKMEVDRSMTTRKEDAESIIGDELAEELDEEAKIIGKSEALVIKSDEEDEPLVEEGKHEKPKKDDEEDEDEEETKKKKEKKSEAEYVQTDITSDTTVTYSSNSDVLEAIAELRADLSLESSSSHPLDIAISELKSVYDEAKKLSDPQEALRMVQEPFEALAAVIQSGFAQEEPEETSESTTDSQSVEVLNAFREELGLFKAEIIQMLQQKTEQPQPQAPARRSINPALLQKPRTEKQSETPKLRAMIEKSVGL